MARNKSRRKRKQRKLPAFVKQENVEFMSERDRNSMMATQHTQREKSNHNNSERPFGCPGPRDSRFEKLVWVPQTTPAIPAERALEDVLREHPEMKFEGIDTGALSATAKAILQVTNEATWQWLQKWCPCTNLAGAVEFLTRGNRADRAATVESLAVPAEAMDPRGIDTPLVKLYRNCCATSAECPAIRPVDVVGIIDNCIIFCLVLKDNERACLLRRVKELLQWIPIGLGCKMIDVQKTASQEISRIARTNLHIDRQKERIILDGAMLMYAKHRCDFEAKLLEQVKMLLDATALVDS
ncbi:hypothetical protein F4818DRAFT_451577 [Hypoxylon cercidicola]|nr:hypothetical protein F4818DRAFT_451577 [Hypoxylon cercidicola]